MPGQFAAASAAGSVSSGSVRASVTRDLQHGGAQKKQEAQRCKRRIWARIAANLVRNVARYNVRRERGRREARSLGDPPMRRTSALISAAPNDVDGDPERLLPTALPFRVTERDENRDVAARVTPRVNRIREPCVLSPFWGFPPTNRPTDVSLLLLLLLLFL